MRDYELMYIIDPTQGDDEACNNYAEQISNVITNSGGTVRPASQQVIGGRRKLAYALRRQSKDVSEGYYVTTQFQAEPQQITEIERVLKLSEPVMRYLITLATPAKATEEAA